MSAIIIDLRGVSNENFPRSARELAELAGLKWPLSPADKERFDQARIFVKPKDFEKLKLKKGGAA